MIIASAPGTCGEFLQGIYFDQPALVSSPIDLFSRTTIKEGSGKRVWKKKAEEAYQLYFETFDIPLSKGENLDISVTSSLPLEKGMASSTADILSVLYALDGYFRTDMTEEQASEIAIKIEPSDNVMFKDLNLYNHYTGEVLEELNSHVSGNVLIINFDHKINTVDFGYETEFKKSKELSEEALRLFKQGLKEKDLSLIGQACTLSAENNQTALEHPYIKEIKTLAKTTEALGILIGHSGSVIGILYDDRFKKDAFIERLKQKDFVKNIENIFDQKLIRGGVHVEELPE